MPKQTPSLDRLFWSMSSASVLTSLNTQINGLSDDDVKERRRTYGENSIQERTRLSKTRIFFGQLKSPLILILVFAGLTTIALHEWVDAGVIFAAVLTNTLLGFWQESKAETVLENLKSYVRTRCRVKRDGNENEIDAKELVPGDIIHVKQGDRIPADARIISLNTCEVDESILTGESLPVEKTTQVLKAGASLADRKNMLYGGTLVVQGYADAVVTGTGSDTEFGRIAALTVVREREQTPLQKSVANFAKWIGIIIAIFTVVLFTGGVFSGYDPKEMFLIAVAVAVSAVPEGMPIALTVILAVGVERLAKKNGVVRKLLAAETLGSTDLILTDKTGTLTEAKMTLTNVLPIDAKTEEDVLEYAVLDADVLIENPKESVAKWIVSGRAMESSLVREAGLRGILLPQLINQTQFIERVPFNSTDKFSSATIERNGVKKIVRMGAPEVIVQQSSSDKKEELLALIDSQAEAGARLLGVSVDDRVMGFLAFRDPVRPSVKAAIKKMQDSGVRTVIVTGDHRGTASAVARELGLLKGKLRVITGSELSTLREEELKDMLDTVAVYARVTPEQKMMLVKLYKEHGNVVAVTGDGVNDGPALLAADIGVAVGSGTDVAKSAADLIILDDNFETIVQAIEEGRQILGNIRKVIVYLLSDATNELFLIGGALVMGIALPINALQILFVNFFSDGFPALAFAFEDIQDNNTRPDRGSSVITRHMRILILGVGVSGSAVLFILYYLLLNAGHDPNLVRTFIFATFSTYSIIVAFSLRSLRTSIFKYRFFSNRFLTTGVVAGFLLTALGIYAPPLQFILKTVALPWMWALGVLFVGICNILVVESVKWVFRHHKEATS
ncbi:MAG: HAD-IC family P-type ATPase [bacterium]|nr:HAD-IC family P-type ATPase [bacterium]